MRTPMREPTATSVIECCEGDERVSVYSASLRSPRAHHSGIEPPERHAPSEERRQPNRTSREGPMPVPPLEHETGEEESHRACVRRVSRWKAVLEGVRADREADDRRRVGAGDGEGVFGDRRHVGACVSVLGTRSYSDEVVIERERDQRTDGEDVQEPEKQAKVSLEDAIRETQRKTHPLPM